MNRKYTFGDLTVDIYYLSERFLTEVIENKEYEPALKDLVVIDAGANIGTFSFTVYNRASEIYAIEPSQVNFDVMNQTIRVNNLEKMKTFLTAISGEGGMRPFVQDDNPELGGWKIVEEGLPLPTITLEQFMNENEIKVVDLLKIDIEGAEKEIFQSESFKRIAPRIHKIVGEFHQYDPQPDLERAGYLYSTYITKSKETRFIAKKI